MLICIPWEGKKVFRVNDYGVNLSNSLICELNKSIFTGICKGNYY